MSTDTNKVFLPHLYDPFRREIAIHYAQHELRKLLPQIRDAALWQSIDEQVREWQDRLSFQNFWNGIHGMSMGFSSKSLVPWITSLNVQWSDKNMPVEELWFGGQFGPITSLGGSESASDIKKNIFLPEYQVLFEQTKKILAERSSETALRDYFPIFTIRKKEKLRVIDGNRRLLQAIVNGEKTIRATVGEPIAEPPLYEHWVPTSLLVDLVFWYKRQIQAGRDTTNTVAHMIAELIRDSSAGRFEFVNRAIHRNDKIHAQLLKAVLKILKDFGILCEN